MPNVKPERRSKRHETTKAPPPLPRHVRSCRPGGQALVRAALVPTAMALLSVTAGPGIGPAVAWARGGDGAPGVARLTRIVNLPGYSGLIDPSGRTIYLVHDTSATSAEIIAFGWRRRKILWRTPDAGLLWPVGTAPSALVLADYAQGGPETFGPLAGLDRETGRTI